MTDAERIDALERRVAELEARLETAALLATVLSTPLPNTVSSVACTWPIPEGWKAEGAPARIVVDAADTPAVVEGQP